MFSSRALERLNQPSSSSTANEDTLETPEEVSYRRAIEQEKDVYKDAIDKLKTLKPEIEMLRKMIEKTRATIETQFNQWYDSLHRRTDLVAMAVNSSSNSNANANSSVSDMSLSTAPLNNNFNNDNYNGKNGNSYSVSSSLSTFADAKDYNNDGSFRRVGSAKQSSVSHNNNSSAKSAMFNDEDVDSDISAFYQAKEELLKQRGMGR